MDQYTKELEELIADILLPAYAEHYRLLGRPSPIRELNQRLLEIRKSKRQIPVLLQKPKY